MARSKLTVRISSIRPGLQFRYWTLSTASHNHKFLLPVGERPLESGTDNLLLSLFSKVSHLGISMKFVSLSLFLFILPCFVVIFRHNQGFIFYLSVRLNFASSHCSTWNIRIEGLPRPKIADWEEITTLPGCSSILSGMMSLWWELAMLGWRRLWLPRGWAAKPSC